jgi:hypothetical protein
MRHIWKENITVSGFIGWTGKTGIFEPLPMIGTACKALCPYPLR